MSLAPQTSVSVQAHFQMESISISSPVQQQIQLLIVQLLQLIQHFQDPRKNRCVSFFDELSVEKRKRRKERERREELEVELSNTVQKLRMDNREALLLAVTEAQEWKDRAQQFEQRGCSENDQPQDSNRQNILVLENQRQQILELQLLLQQEKNMLLDLEIKLEKEKNEVSQLRHNLRKVQEHERELEKDLQKELDHEVQFEKELKEEKEHGLQLIKKLQEEKERAIKTKKELVEEKARVEELSIKLQDKTKSEDKLKEHLLEEKDRGMQLLKELEEAKETAEKANKMLRREQELVVSLMKDLQAERVHTEENYMQLMQVKKYKDILIAIDRKVRLMVTKLKEILEGGKLIEEKLNEQMNNTQGLVVFLKKELEKEKQHERKGPKRLQTEIERLVKNLEDKETREKTLQRELEVEKEKVEMLWNDMLKHCENTDKPVFYISNPYMLSTFIIEKLEKEEHNKTLISKILKLECDHILLDTELDTYRNCDKNKQKFELDVITALRSKMETCNNESEVVSKQSFLPTAAKEDDLKSALFLLCSGVKTNLTDESGYSALHWAAYNGNLDLVKVLHHHGANLTQKTNDLYENSPAHIAVSYGHLNVTQWFLSKGVSVDIRNAIGSTLLIIAAWYGFEDLSRLILANGAQLDVGMYNWDNLTALHASTINGNFEVVKLLLDNGVKIDFQSSVTKRTALHFAIWNGNQEVIQLLIDRGADEDIIDYQGKSPKEIVPGSEIFIQFSNNS